MPDTEPKALDALAEEEALARAIHDAAAAHDPRSPKQGCRWPCHNDLHGWYRGKARSLIADAAAAGYSLVPSAIAEFAVGYLEVNNEPCWFDHHGGCQAHGYLDLDGEPCPQGRALASLPAEQPATPETER